MENFILFETKFNKYIFSLRNIFISISLFSILFIFFMFMDIYFIRLIPPMNGFRLLVTSMD